jgi:molybdate-binding protein/DNA-binding XRE family transcriptional regulator
MRPDSLPRNQLRSIRTRLALSQQELAEAAGVTRQTVGGIEGGLYAPSVAVALRLSRALGCRVEELFWLDEDLPAIDARASGDLAAVRDGERVAVVRVNGQWVAHSLAGEAAFRDEMIPADGIAEPAEGTSLRVRLLDESDALERTVALAGCTPVLSLWARAAERWNPGLRVHWTFANSTRALERLAAGEVHAAGLHLYDADSGEYNTPYVRRALAGKGVLLFNLGVWDEGLVVTPGMDGCIRSAADLAEPGVRIVNREVGAGARLVLEEALQAAGVPAQAVAGFDHCARGHLEVARAVADGHAHAGVTTTCVARAFGLPFIPLKQVRYDLAVLQEYVSHAPVRQLFSTLEHRWVRSQLSVLGGYDTSRTGEVVAEVRAA